MIYVAARSKNTVYRIDPVTLKKSFEARLFCEGAHSIKMDENRQYIYVADSYGKSISVFDRIREERKMAGVGTSPSHIVLCRRNDAIYVANYDSDSISVVDQKSLCGLFTIKTGSMPHHICLSGDERHLYVSLMGNNKIAVIDTDKNKNCGFVGLDATPMHMRVGELTGRIYVACTNFEKSVSGEIIILDEADIKREEQEDIEIIREADKKNLKRYPVGKYLSDLCVVEEKDLIYVLDGQENRMYAMDLTNGKIVRKTVTGEFPSTIEYDKKTDRLVVGTHIGNMIEGYDRETLRFISACKVESDFGHLSC